MCGMGEVMVCEMMWEMVGMNDSWRRGQERGWMVAKSLWVGRTKLSHLSSLRKWKW